jgi:HEAT repeat protein
MNRMPAQEFSISRSAMLGGAAAVIGFLVVWWMRSGGGGLDRPQPAEPPHPAQPALPANIGARSDGPEWDAADLRRAADCFLDPSQSLAKRRDAAARLIAHPTREALAALLCGFIADSPEGQRALAAMMQASGDPVFGELLASLFETGIDSDASAAIRGLAVLGGEESVRRLTELMNDDAWPDSLRTEAAVALLETVHGDAAKAAVRALGLIGGPENTAMLVRLMAGEAWPEAVRLEAIQALAIIGTPEARDALIDASWRFEDPAIHAEIIESLSRFPFGQIEPTWRQILDDPNTPGAIRVAAAESLANSTAEAVPLLSGLVAHDRDPEVREMAAWALTSVSPEGTLGPELAGYLASEPDTDVRRRLYEALMVQANYPAETIFPMIERETDPAARIAGLNVVGKHVGTNPASPLVAEFDTRSVPELLAMALSDAPLNLRMRSVFALRRAGTPPAREALEKIAANGAPKIKSAAENGLAETIRDATPINQRNP